MEKLLAVYLERIKPIQGNSAVDHLRWMLEQIPKFTDDPRKQQRWLGFIQGSCWLLKVFTIDEMREHVRQYLQSPALADEIVEHNWIPVAEQTPPDGVVVETKIASQDLGDWCLIQRAFVNGVWKHDVNKWQQMFPVPTHWHKIAALVAVLALVGCRWPGVDQHEHERAQPHSTGTNEIQDLNHQATESHPYNQ